MSTIIRPLAQHLCWLLAIAPLTAAQTPMSQVERAGHTVLFPLVRPLPVSNEKVFQDRLIRIEFSILTSFAFRLENRSGSSIEVDWDHSSYVDPRAVAHRVTHTGVRYIDRDNPDSPTLVPPGSAIEDALIPVDCVEYADGKWKVRDAFLLVEITEPGAFFQGRKFRLLIAIRSGSIKKTYDFSFHIPQELRRKK
jgi:hypothetical protein